IMQRSKRIVKVLKNNLDINNHKKTVQPKRKMKKVSKKILVWSSILIFSFLIAFIIILKNVDKSGIGIKSVIEQYGLWATSREFIQEYTVSILQLFIFIFVI